MNELYHYGVIGMKWGIRRYQNSDGSLTDAGRKRYAKDRVFVSGSSKTQDPTSKYYSKKLPKNVAKELDQHIKANKRILVGDAPGIDRQVQDYLKAKHYENVEVYSPGKEARYLANKHWQNVKVDVPGAEEGSKEWLVAKDLAMRENATEGLAVILPHGGASATRDNILDLVNHNKKVSVFQMADWHDLGTATGLNRDEILGECKIQSAMDKSVSRAERVKRQKDILSRANLAAPAPNKKHYQEPDNMSEYLYMSIYGRVNSKSGDFFTNKGSKDYEDIIAKAYDAQKKYYKKELDWKTYEKINSQLHNELSGAALRDIGFEDTPELRKLMQHIRG